MDVIQGGKGNKIAGCRVGETISIFLMTGMVDKVVLTDITRIGIEGHNVGLKDSPLTFYPYYNILKIKKYTEV
jgi:hypothetical protein